jgi:hydrogenase expression/formation protein HypE
LAQKHDGSVFPAGNGLMAFTTDSFVVNPPFFPGGNIGDLAVNGTVNDLVCCGAVPLYLSAGFILEEGFPIVLLKKIVDSMRMASKNAGISIITGDTKVVERGKCDRIFINTSGIGTVAAHVHISPFMASVGDVVICTGQIGVHGIVVLSARENLGFATDLQSDTRSLHRLVSTLLSEIPDVHVLRDPTRGGVATTLNEIALASKTDIELDETSLPVPETVCNASEMLGLDPLYIANEGIALVILPEKHAAKAISLLRSYPEGKDAAVIGKITGKSSGTVKVRTTYGNRRIIQMLEGEQLPRIC